MDLHKMINYVLVFLFICYMPILYTVRVDATELSQESTPGTDIQITEQIADTTKMNIENKTDEIETAVLEEESHWVSIGNVRITHYCPACNDPRGSYQSSSGTYLYSGCVACRWLPNGSKIRINGDEYLVVDTCGTDAIDIFIDSDECYCSYHGTYYAEVEVYK